MCTVERLDWDLRLLILAFQINYFLFSPMDFLPYKTDIATSLKNTFEICRENCDIISSIFIIFISIAIMIRRKKIVLRRPDSRIRVFHNFFLIDTSMQTVFFVVFCFSDKR